MSLKISRANHGRRVLGNTKCNEIGRKLKNACVSILSTILSSESFFFFFFLSNKVYFQTQCVKKIKS